MSCPYVSGLAAIVRGVHSQWSLTAIRSALMTAAYTSYKNGATIEDVVTGQPATPFDYGTGHVNPVAALDPGLVYDADVEDYLGFFCVLNYTSFQIKLAARRDFTCDPKREYRVEDFNYPSFVGSLKTTLGIGGGSDAPHTMKYSRVLTNVGALGTYKASVMSLGDSNLKIMVESGTLSFAQEYKKKSYMVSFTHTFKPSRTSSFALLEWTDGNTTLLNIFT